MADAIGFRLAPEVPSLRQCRSRAFGDSSSQTPSDASLCIRSAKPIARRKACALGASRNPSPRRRRQVSSVPLLVLSKLQTLRWFAIWFHLSCQKKWAKRGAGYESDCTAVPQKYPVEERCGQHTRLFLQSYTTAPPAWKQRSHRESLPRQKMAKHAAVECSTHLRMRR